MSEPNTPDSCSRCAELEQRLGVLEEKLRLQQQQFEQALRDTKKSKR